MTRSSLTMRTLMTSVLPLVLMFTCVASLPLVVNLKSNKSHAVASHDDVIDYHEADDGEYQSPFQAAAGDDTKKRAEAAGGDKEIELDIKLVVKVNGASGSQPHVVVRSSVLRQTGQADRSVDAAVNEKATDHSNTGLRPISADEDAAAAAADAQLKADAEALAAPYKGILVKDKNDATELDDGWIGIDVDSKDATQVEDGLAAAWLLRGIMDQF